jgi:hypothetical protein
LQIQRPTCWWLILAERLLWFRRIEGCFAL